MPSRFVLTLTGPDRIGIVEEVTGILLNLGGNVETSRMVRLGGEFAMLMLVALPADQTGKVDDALAGLKPRGYTVTTGRADSAEAAESRPGWASYRIQVDGADHEGIIHEVAQYLAGRGINIEAVESESTLASTSGVPLFSMTARVVVPPDEAGSGWEAGLDEIGTRLNLDITAVRDPGAV